MTDYSQLPDDQINRMVAEAMGLFIDENEYGYFLSNPDRKYLSPSKVTTDEAWMYCPDYLHDPVALEDVKRWVESKVQRWEVTWNFELYSLSTWDDPFNVNVITGSLDTEAKAWCIAALMLKEAQK